MTTICANCKNRIITSSGNPDMWYNNKCLASPIGTIEVDLVTGKTVEQEYHYCRDINTGGNCKLYEAINQRQ